MDVKEFLNKDRFAAYIGIELLEVGKGKAKAKIDIKKEHLNALNIVQGGVIFTLADLTLAAAANSYDNIAITLSANISFYKASGLDTLYAEAVEISKNSKIASFTINITNENNDLISSAQGLVYFKNSSQDRNLG